MMEIIVDDKQIDIWPIGAAVLAIFIIILWRRKQSVSYLLCCAAFGIYLLFAIARAFFPIMLSGIYADEMRQLPQVSSFINLIPFNFNFSEIPNIVFAQIVQNILLTVPFGFGVNFVARVRAKDIVWVTVAVGIGIEATQFAISLLLRYPYRVIDINDVMLNAAGVLIGYGIFRVFAWLYVALTQRLGITHGGLAAYIYDIASRSQAVLQQTIL